MTDYKLYWDIPNDSESWLLLAASTTPSFEYTVSSLSAGLEYKFRLVAINLIGDSDASVTAAFIASSLPDAPSVP